MLYTTTRVFVAAAALLGSAALGGPTTEHQSLSFEDISDAEGHSEDRQHVVLHAGIFSPIIIVSLPELVVDEGPESNTQMTAASDLADTVDRVGSTGVIIKPEPFKADLDPAQLGESGTLIQSYRRGNQLSSR